MRSFGNCRATNSRTHNFVHQCAKHSSLVVFLEARRIYLADKTAALVILELSEAHAAVAPRKEKPFGSSRYGHIEEAALLLDATFLDGHLRRKEIFLQTDDKDGTKLQSLGSMNGHERDGRLALFVVLVLVGEQGNVLQIVGKQDGTSFLFVVGDRCLKVVNQCLEVFLTFTVFGLLAGIYLIHKPRLTQHSQGQSVGPFGRNKGIELIDKLSKTLQSCLCGAVYAKLVTGRIGKHEEGRNLVVDGRLEHFVEGGLADASGRIVNDSPQGFLIVGVHGQSQIGNGILDLLTLVERKSAIYAVWKASALEFVFEGLTLTVGSIQNGNLTIVEILMANQVADIPRNDGSLLLVAIGFAEFDGLAQVLHALYVLVYLALIVVDDAVGRIHNGLRGAIVLLQFEELGSLISLLESEDIVDASASERIDALGIVANNADALAMLCQQPHYLVLGIVGVLILIDEYKLESVFVLLANLGMLFQ